MIKLQLNILQQNYALASKGKWLEKWTLGWFCVPSCNVIGGMVNGLLQTLTE